MITARTLPSRRSVLQGGAAAGLLASSALRRPAWAGLTLANAVQFFQGTSSKLSSVLLQDTNKLGATPVLSTQSIFGQTAIQFTKYMPLGWPGRMVLMSITDSLGHPRFQVNILPPNPAFDSNPNTMSLQIAAWVDSGGSSYFSYVIPNLIPNDGAWRTINFGVGIIPGTVPARWIVEAVAVNQATGRFAMPTGYWTTEDGSGAISQVAPTAFTIPLVKDTLNPNGSLVFSMGLPMTASGGGYQPVAGLSSHFDALAANVAETWLHFNPVGQVDLATTLPQFLNYNFTGLSSKINAAVGASAVKATTTYDVLAQLARNYQLPTYTSATQNISGLQTSISAALATVRSGSSAYFALKSAAEYARFAGVYLSAGATTANIQNAMNNVMGSMNALDTALSEANLTPSPVTQVPTATIDTVNNVTVSSGSPPPTVVLSGNSSVGTQVNTGDLIPASDNSYAYNQAGGVLVSPPGMAPAQAPQDPYMTIESITVTPTLP